MRVAILHNRKNAGLRQLGKRLMTTSFQALSGDFSSVVLPEFNSFAELLDSSPIVQGVDDSIDWSRLEKADLLIWEWGWTAEPASAMLKIRERLGLATLMFPGPLDRFWRELAPQNLELQLRAAAASDAIGAMLEDTVSFYRSLIPDAHVFHLPVPLDLAAFQGARQPDTERDRNLLLLTAPTCFTGASSQVPVTTFVAFRRLLKHRPELRGICFTYDDAEHAGAEQALRALGLIDRVEIRPYLRPIQRYLSAVAPCWASLALPHGMLQGRNAMTAAALGIPVVASEEIETHRRVFPQTSVRWYDTDGAVRLGLRLLEDDGFRRQVVAEADQKIQMYSVEQCKNRLLAGAQAAIARRPGRKSKVP